MRLKIPDTTDYRKHGRATKNDDEDDEVDAHHVHFIYVHVSKWFGALFSCNSLLTILQQWLIKRKMEKNPIVLAS